MFPANLRQEDVTFQLPTKLPPQDDTFGHSALPEPALAPEPLVPPVPTVPLVPAVPLVLLAPVPVAAPELPPFDAAPGLLLQLMPMPAPANGSAATSTLRIRDPPKIRLGYSFIARDRRWRRTVSDGLFRQCA
jgi:hypothetical protein